jgi:hypothetical protein
MSTIFLSPLPIERMRRGEVADVLYSLEDHGVDTSHMTMHLNAKHAYCWDLDFYLGRLYKLGYATDYDPLHLTSEGIEICKRNIAAETQMGAKEQLDHLNNLLKKYIYDNGKIIFQKEPEKEAPRRSLLSEILKKFK